MARRQRLISSSILRAIFTTNPVRNHDTHRPPLLARILAFFSLFSLTLARYRDQVFTKLRTDAWLMEEEEYAESFRSPSKGKRTDLKSVGDLGYSGSVCSIFFSISTTNRSRPSSPHQTQSSSSNHCRVDSNSPSFANNSSTPMSSTCTWTTTRSSSV